MDKNPVTVRVLPPEEYPALLDTPLFSMLGGIPDLDHTRIVVGQDDITGKIIAFWIMFDAVHVEPLWIHEGYRKRPGIARRLWETLRKLMISNRVPIAFGVIHDADTASNLPMAMRLGFKKLPGDLFYITPDPAGFNTAKEKVEGLMRDAVAAATELQVRS